MAIRFPAGPRKLPFPRLPKPPRASGAGLGRRVIGEGGALRAWERVPPDFAGSPGEWAIYWAHDKSGLGPEGPTWQFQPGYWLNVGGFIPDFVEEDVRVTINVRDVGGHAEGEARERANERLRGIIALGRGFRHIVIEAPHALSNPFFYLSEARAGRSHAQE